MTQTTLGPVQAQERIQTIDIIRGFALLGITVVNFTVDTGHVSPIEGRTAIVDQLFYWPIKLFMDDKFMDIYCFLFGLGFSIQMFRAEARGSSFVFLYMRRLLVFTLIGAAATILISARSVLYDYAMLGALLLLLHKLNKKLILLLVLLCLLIPWTISFCESWNKEIQMKSNRTYIVVDSTILERYVGIYLHHENRKNPITRVGNKLWLTRLSGEKIQLLPQSETVFHSQGAKFTFWGDSLNKLTFVTAEKDSFTAIKIQPEKNTENTISPQRHSNTYIQSVVNRARWFWEDIKHWSWSDFFWNWHFNIAFPLFLLGLYAGKRKIFNEIFSHRQFLRNVMKWGFLIGITGVSISLGYDAWNYINDINKDSYSYLLNFFVRSEGPFWQLGVLMMALAYVAGLTLLLENINWKKRLSFLAPVGRMGLTNYLLQLIAIDILFFRGFNNPDKFGPFWRTIFALIVFALLVIISRWWFKYFRMGPLEWLWRSLTYLKFQPMRVKKTLVS